MRLAEIDLVDLTGAAQIAATIAQQNLRLGSS